nr:hypothetical protein Itr_chr12CG14640 [Ipomoea trifida]
MVGAGLWRARRCDAKSKAWIRWQQQRLAGAEADDVKPNNGRNIMEKINQFPRSSSPVFIKMASQTMVADGENLTMVKNNPRELIRSSDVLVAGDVPVVAADVPVAAEMPHPPTVAADMPPEGSLIEEIQFFWNEAERPSIDLGLTITTGVASCSPSSADLLLTITAGVTFYSPSPIDLSLTITVR